MATPKKVVIVGDGTAGIAAANKLRFSTTLSELEVTVVGNSSRHFYKADGVLIPFGYRNYRKSVRPTNFLLNYGIDYIKDDVIRIDVKQRAVFLRSGRSMVADYLIIASGNRNAPEELPGYEGEAKHFFDLQHSLEIREYMKSFNGGQIVVGSSNRSDAYFPTLAEFSLLMKDYIKEHSLDGKSPVVFLTPNDENSFSKFASLLSPIMEKCGIEVHKKAEITSVDSKNKEVVLSDGQKVKYNLLVASPPMRGRGLISDISAVDEYGYAKVDPKNLTVGGYDDTYAIGDAQRNTIFRSAVSAHRQAMFVSSRIVADCVSGLSEPEYRDSTHGIIITGKDKAASYDGNASGDISMGPESPGNFLIRNYSADTYFSSILRGMI